ncbi:MAG: hypothetical protein Kow0068_05640 [Marinilabiliales bacterium]
MKLFKIFKKIQVDNNTKETIISRDMSIESIINKFRIVFLIIISIFDTVEFLRNKEKYPKLQFEIIATFLFLIAFSFVITLYFLLKKGYFRKWIKYATVTFDLVFTMAYSVLILFIIDYPLPVSKDIFVIMLYVLSFLILLAYYVLKKSYHL